MPSEPMSLMDAIFQRRAVRRYAPERLSKEAVMQLLRAAVRAPTAIHEEPWVFAVVQDAALLHRISERAKASFGHPQASARGANLPGAKHFAQMVANKDFNIFYDAGTLVVFGARPLGDFGVADCWLAAENLMLAATAQGLGSCVIGSALGALNAPEVKAELGFSPEVRAVAAVILGVPAGETEVTSRKEPEVVWR